jgi:hypothetical protein
VILRFESSLIPVWRVLFKLYVLDLDKRLTKQPTESHDDSPMDAADPRWDVFYELERYIRVTFPLL